MIYGEPSEVARLVILAIPQLSLAGRLAGREGEKERRTIASTLRLFVDLEPEGYRRERGFGNSYEPKDNACTLQIEGDELEQIQEALRQELKDAYQFLYDKGLLAAYARHKEQQEPPSEADLPDKNLSA